LKFEDVNFNENKKSRREEIDPSNYITETPVSNLNNYFD
jgi:hypothetical protein